MRQYFVAVIQLHAKHRVRQRLRYTPLRFDDVFLGHSPPVVSYNFVKIRGGPLGWIAIVCSKCAERLPSFVTAVHWSSNTRTSLFPMFTIGSIASTIPTCSRGPCPGFP